MAEKKEGESKGVRLDLSLNLPTLLTLVGMLASTLVYVNNRFMDLTSFDVAANARLTNIEDRLKGHDADIALIRADTVTQNAALRADMRADLRDVKQSLDTISAKLMGK